jgi:hypothetical protein
VGPAVRRELLSPDGGVLFCGARASVSGGRGVWACRSGGDKGWRRKDTWARSWVRSGFSSDSRSGWETAGLPDLGRRVVGVRVSDGRCGTDTSDVHL